MKKILCLFLVVLLFISGCSTTHEKAGTKSMIVTQAEKGNITKVQNLLQQGANINETDHAGRTPIMAATYANQIDMVKLLIEKGADIHQKDNMENNPFLYAGAEGLNEILALTIQAGADPSLLNRYGGTALIPAAEKGHLESAKMLLEKTDININHINHLGWTALLEAIILNDGDSTQQKMVKLLIRHEADLTIADKNNVTPLAHARQKGFQEIEKILLDAGATR